MATKDYLDKLADAAEELNDVLGLEPPIVTANTTLGALKKAIGEARQLIAPEDELSKSTRDILDHLNKPDQTPAPTLAGDTLALVREIEATTNRRELKLIAKRQAVFSQYMKELGTIKDGEGLQVRMVEIVVAGNANPDKGAIADTIEDVPAKPAPKAEKPTKAAKQPTVPKDAKPAEPAEAVETEAKPGKAKSGKAKPVSTPKKNTGEPSNKMRVYTAWKKGQTDALKLAELVKDAVKVSTIRSWTSAWGQGKNLPADARG